MAFRVCGSLDCYRPAMALVNDKTKITILVRLPLLALHINLYGGRSGRKYFGVLFDYECCLIWLCITCFQDERNEDGADRLLDWIQLDS